MVGRGGLLARTRQEGQEVEVELAGARECIQSSLGGPLWGKGKSPG